MFNTNHPNLSKLGQCELCEEMAKYKCPRCGLCSCSLSCVRAHKTQRNCNGIRNRVNLISKDKMDNFTLLSDYRFLEEIDHKLEDGRRNPLRRLSRKSQETLSELPPHLKRLKMEAKKRKTIIEFMPKHFLMHQENSTRFLFAERTIRWHIKWLFPQAADLSFSEKSVDEHTSLVDLLRKYMEPRHRLDDDDDDDAAATQSVTPSAQECERLSYYQSASYRRVAVVVKSVAPDSMDQKYVELNLSKSLKVNLAHKYVVEYPVFYVVLRDHLDAYIGDEREELGTWPEPERAPFGNPSPPSLGSGALTQRHAPRVKKMDGGLKFFNAHSDVSDESE